jgi:hypothetical protein
VTAGAWDEVVVVAFYDGHDDGHRDFQHDSDQGKRMETNGFRRTNLVVTLSALEQETTFMRNQAIH